LTADVYGSCSRVVWTGAREHGPRTRVSKMTPVLDTRAHGPLVEHLLVDAPSNARWTCLLNQR